MRRILFLFIVNQPLLFASSIQNDYLNIYIDQLINQFDNSHNNSVPLFQNPVYRKIIAGRFLLEKRNSINNYAEKSLVMVTNPKIYEDVVNLVAREAEKIEWEINLNKSNSLYIYPSVGPDGNLTGNTFPSHTWSLTFDDGPRGERTKKIVDQLYQSGVKATFFMLTSQAKRYPESVQYVIDNKMEVALHSYTHANLSKADAAGLEYEISTALNDLKEETNKEIHFFRLPYGAGTRKQDVRSLIASKKLIHVFWNVDTLDWKDKNPDSIVKRVLLQMSRTPNKSGIILFHDIHPQTVIASKKLLDLMLERQLNLCTVGSVTDYINGNESDCPIDENINQEKK